MFFIIIRDFGILKPSPKNRKLFYNFLIHFLDYDLNRLNPDVIKKNMYKPCSYT
jgi:hypothetical protein